MNIKEKVIVYSGNKYFLWVVIAIVIISGVFAWRYHASQLEEAASKKERQLQGILSEKERELQSANLKIGVAESKLMTQESLIESHKEEAEKISGEFKTFVEKHNLTLKSYERVIAELKQKIGGTTTVVVNGDCNTNNNIIPPIKYEFVDDYKRFHLTDEDIFKEGNETLEIRQTFKIIGEIYQETNGYLQTKRLQLKEVVVGEDGKYKEIANAEIVDFRFNYTVAEPTNAETWFDRNFDYLTLISAVGWGYNSNLKIGVGMEWLRLKNVELGLVTQIDLELDIPKNSGIAAGLVYRIPKSNVGVGVNVGTEFAEFFNMMYITGSIVFYIW